MSVNSAASFETFDGNGSTSTPYPIVIQRDRDEDIKLLVGGAAETGFTVAGDGLRTTVAVAPGTELYVYRVTPDTQDNPFPSSTTPPSEDVGAAVDKNTLQIRENRDMFNRVAIAPIGETIAPLPAAADRAEKIEKWSADGLTKEMVGSSEFLADDLAAAAASAAAASTSAGEAASSAGSAAASVAGIAADVDAAAQSAADAAESEIAAAANAAASDSSRLMITANGSIATSRDLVAADMGEQLSSTGAVTLTLPSPIGEDFLGGIVELSATAGVITFAGSPLIDWTLTTTVNSIPSGTLDTWILRATLGGWTIEPKAPNAALLEAIGANPGATRTALELDDAITIPEEITVPDTISTIAAMGDHLISDDIALSGTIPYHGMTVVSMAIAMIGGGPRRILHPTTSRNFAAGNLTLAEIKTDYLALVIAEAPDACVVLGGSYMTSPDANSMFSSIVEIATELRTAGIRPILGTLPPPTADVTGTDLATVILFNQLLREYCTRRGVLVFECFAPLADATTGFLHTDFHRSTSSTEWKINNAAHLRVAANLANVLLEYTVPVSVIPDDNHPNWITTNSNMTGSTGGIATGWEIFIRGAGGWTPTKVTRTDRIPGEYQQIVVAGTTEDDGCRFVDSINPGSGWDDNDVVKGVFEIEFVDGGGNPFLYHGKLYITGGTTPTTYTNKFANVELADVVSPLDLTVPVGNRKLVFETPEMNVGESGTKLYFELDFRGPCTVRISRAGAYRLRNSPPVTTIAYLGDSQSAGATGIGDSSIANTRGGYMWPIHALYGQNLEWVTHAIGTNFNNGGYTIAQIRDSLVPLVVAETPDLCVLMGGTNSLTAAAAMDLDDLSVGARWMFDQLMECVTTLTAAGIQVVIATVTPDNYTIVEGTYGDGERNQSYRDVKALLNEMIVEQAPTYGALVCDWFDVIAANPGNPTSAADPGYLDADTDVAPVHYGYQGNWALGKFAADFINEKFQVPAPFTIPISGSALWATPNPYFANEVGGLATDWLAIVSTGVTMTTVKASANVQRAYSSDSPEAGDGNGSWRVRVDVDVADTSFDGKTYRAVFKVTPVLDGPVAWGVYAIGTFLELTGGGVSAVESRDPASNNSNLLAVCNAPGPTDELILMSAPCVHPGGTGTRTIRATLFINGPGTVDIESAGVFEVI